MRNSGLVALGIERRAAKKVVNPRAGSRWLFAFAALSELPLGLGKWLSLRCVVAQRSKGLANADNFGIRSKLYW